MKLFLVRFRVTWWNFVEYLKVVFRYYSNRPFRQADLYLLRHYITESPYQTSKRYLREKGEADLYTYGETPLTTLEGVARVCGIHSRDCVYELGCGRGRGCFWLHYFLKCSVYGVEQVPWFVRIAQRVRRKYQIENVKFICGDMLEADLSAATVVYFYGTCSEPSFIQKLCEKLKRLSRKTKIITVSYPLTDYSQDFKVIKTFPARFPWGETDVYLQVPK